MVKISKKDLLTPYIDFEKAHNIKHTRNDIPKSYLGMSPSKYYRSIEMNLEKLRKKVENMFKKFRLKNHS